MTASVNRVRSSMRGSEEGRVVPESGRVEVGEGGGSVPVPSPSEARVELLVRVGAIVLAFSRARERADYAVTVRF